MRKILLLAAIFILFFSGSDYLAKIQQKNDTDDLSVFRTLENGLTNIKETIDIESLLHYITDIFDQMDDSFTDFQLENKEHPENIIEQPTLTTPVQQLFSVANIEIGDTKAIVEKLYGEAKRVTKNEYGTDWHAYHDKYRNFFMVAYNESGGVVGLYTNQDLLAGKNEIKMGTAKETVRELMGEPLSSIKKGFTNYMLESKRDYDMFHSGNSFITFFYDKHENNTVTAIQIINNQLENSKEVFYTNGTDELMEGFELQLFDLTNATRVKFGLSPLVWDDHVRITARKHSLDMAKNDYFNHTNLQGLSPFDRMKADHIHFTMAGENLAYGQLSSIFAHEGLMNSLGHRKNILQHEYEYLGVGVAFNSESQPYFTEKFYKK
ncbi:CAP domain-containing protein [Bacillus kwashiorkori]|uniref:CAP domain-containing protein n=1 Tax=Bacillus kwashiorkori TaxID=1522318 RepID=UPI000783573D|nr:CAP domain-containing protein [Bacillus kwashiorkori]